MPSITKPDNVSWIEVFRRTFKEANEDDVMGRSAQLSYYFFLALFPMLITIISVMSLFGHADSTRQTLLGFLAGVLPGSASELTQKTLMEVIQGAGGLKMSFGIVFSLWSASAGMSAIMDTLNAEYEVTEGRSFLRRYGTAVGGVLTETACDPFNARSLREFLLNSFVVEILAFPAAEIVRLRIPDGSSRRRGACDRERARTRGRSRADHPDVMLGISGESVI